MDPTTGLAVGVTISVLGSICSNFGQNVQKHSMSINDALPVEERSAN